MAHKITHIPKVSRKRLAEEMRENERQYVQRQPKVEPIEDLTAPPPLPPLVQGP